MCGNALQGTLGVLPYCGGSRLCTTFPLVTKDQETLIWYAYHHSEELGQAVEAVIKAEGHQTTEQAERLYKLLKQDGGKHLSPDVFMALIHAIRSR